MFYVLNGVAYMQLIGRIKITDIGIDIAFYSGGKTGVQEPTVRALRD